MITSVRELLVRHEGVRRKAYDDRTGKTLRRGGTLGGHLSIGVGRNLSQRGLTRREIAFLLDNDIARATRGAAAYPWFAGLSPPRQAVCISMVFNCGPAGWAGFKKTHAALASARWDEAAMELLQSRYAEQVGDRALHLAELLRQGEWLPL